jgi:hypothetical protein
VQLVAHTVGVTHGLRNEITANKLCNAERPQMGSRSHRLLLTLEKFRMTRRNHERNEERFQAIFFERCLSFREVVGRRGS